MSFDQILDLGSLDLLTVVLTSEDSTMRADWANHLVYLFGVSTGEHNSSVPGIVRYGLASSSFTGEVLASTIFGSFPNELLTDQNLVGPSGELYLAGAGPGSGTVGLPAAFYRVNPADFSVVANFGTNSYLATTAIKSGAVLAGGSGYTHASVAVSGTYGSGGTATATVAGGKVTAIAITAGGNYSAAPVLTISGDGTGALAVVASMSVAQPFQASDSSHVANSGDCVLVAKDSTGLAGPFIVTCQRYAPVQPVLYDVGVTYAKGNVVYDGNGAFWISCQDGNVGNALVNGFDYTGGTLVGAWLLVMAWGETGAATLSTPGTYFWGDPVSWAGQVWFCQQDGTLVAGGIPTSRPGVGGNWSPVPPGWIASDTHGWRHGDVVWYSDGTNAGALWMVTVDLSATASVPAGPNWLNVGGMGLASPGTRIGTASVGATGGSGGHGAEVATLDCRSGMIGFLAGTSFGLDEPQGHVCADGEGNGKFIVLGGDAYDAFSNSSPQVRSTMALGVYAGLVTVGGSSLTKKGTIAPGAIVGPNGPAQWFLGMTCGVYDHASDVLVAQVWMRDSTTAKWTATIGITVATGMLAWTVLTTDIGFPGNIPPSSYYTLNTFADKGGTFVQVEVLPAGSGATGSRVLQVAIATGVFSETMLAGVRNFGGGMAYSADLNTMLLPSVGYDSTQVGAPKAIGGSPSAFFWYAALSVAGIDEKSYAEIF